MRATESSGDLPNPQARIWVRVVITQFQFHTICPQISFTTRMATGFGERSKCRGSGMFCVQLKGAGMPGNSMPGSCHWGSGWDCCLPLRRDVLESPNENSVKPSAAGSVSGRLGKRCQIAPQARGRENIGNQGKGSKRYVDILLSRECAFFLGESSLTTYCSTASPSSLFLQGGLTIPTRA